jgi:thioredoxin 1
MGDMLPWVQEEAMPVTTRYLGPAEAPARETVDQMAGPVLVEFGTEWCGFCRALQPQVETLLGQHPEVQHVKVEDGPGQPLGRSFKVRLWPNLVFLQDGRVVQQLARPSRQELEAAFEALAGK